jgi:diphosphomevalonate decarboxylase
LRDGDFKTLGEIVEHSALKMHASMWASRPAINYWLPQTLQLMNLVYDLRRDLGPVAYFTMDAGPHVKVLCPSKYISQVADSISRSGYAERVLCSKPGRGAYLRKEHIS